jgi:MSHA biogenesis protein MshM
MYEDYWNLKRRPFASDLASEAFFPARSHQSALLKLQYLVDHQPGLGLISAETGIGKSRTLEALAQHATSQNGLVASIVYPQLSPLELMQELHSQLAAAAEEGSGSLVNSESLGSVLDGLLTTIRRATAAKRPVVLLIDDAHLIDERATWLAFHQLSNFMRPQSCEFSLVLSGQLDLLSQVRRYHALDERIAFRCLLTPLTPAETVQYVEFRLAFAGSGKPLFDASALKAVFELSQGNLRRINRLCDFGLLVGYSDGLEALSREHLEGVHEELLQATAA